MFPYHAAGCKGQGGYLKIINNGAENRLVNATAERTRTVQLHEMKMDGSIMVMREDGHTVLRSSTQLRTSITSRSARHRLASEIPCSGHRSAACAPASCSRNTDDLLFRKSLLLHKSVLNRPDPNQVWRKFAVADR